MRRVAAERTWQRTLLEYAVHLAVFVALLALFVSLARLAGIHRDFRGYVDSDIVIVYEALRLNAGLPSHDLQHPGYIHYLLVGFWIRGADILGFVPLSTLRELHFADDYRQSWQQVVEACRYFAPTLAALYAFAFYGFAYNITRRAWPETILAAAVFATTLGFSIQSRIIRVELTMTFFCFLAFACLVLGARARGERKTVPLAFLGAFFAVLAVFSKIQGIVILLALPALLLVTNGFSRSDAGSTGSSDCQPSTPRCAWLATIQAWATAHPVVCSIAALSLFWIAFAASVHGLSDGRTAAFGYQLILYVYAVSCFAILAWFRETPFTRASKIFAAACLGAVCAATIALYRHHPNIWLVSWNFIETMSQYTMPDFGLSRNVPQDRLLGLEWHRYVEIVSSLAEPVVGRNAYFPFALAWPSDGYGWTRLSIILLAGLAVFTRHGWWNAWWALCLLGLAAMVELSFGLRKFYPHYWILIEVWSALGLVFLLERWRGEPVSWRAMRLGVLVVCVALIVGFQSREIQTNIPVQDDYRWVCGIAVGYLSELRHQFGC